MAALRICLINQKGGCGKSSTTFHLAGAFATAGMSVLLVDADPQGSLSQGFLGSSFVEELPVERTLAALFSEDCFFVAPESVVWKTGFERISIIPCNQHLSEFNAPKPENSGLVQFTLRDFLDEQPNFDVTLIDCPPNLYQCSWNAMVSCSHCLIPVPPEDFGTQGLRAVHQSIDNARRLNPALRRLGHLVTRYDRRLLIHRSYEERLRSLYSEMVLETIVPEVSAFKVALTCSKPVEYYAKKSKAAESIRNLMNEILERTVSKRQKQNAG